MCPTLITTELKRSKARSYSPALGRTQKTRLPGLTVAEDKAVRITTFFETGKPLRFDLVAGNFDKQGISFGLLQRNFGTGSLQPLLKRFLRLHPKRFDRIFGRHAKKFRQVLSANRAQQMQFALSINNRRARIIEPWHTYFRRLGNDKMFQQIQIDDVRKMLNVARRYAIKLGLKTERGFVLIFDNVVNNGPYWLWVKGRRALIRKRHRLFQRRKGRKPTEKELLTIIANVVADTVSGRWRKHIRQRKMTIVTGRGWMVGRIIDLGREFGLSDQPWRRLASDSTAYSSLGELQEMIAPSIRRVGITPISSRQDITEGKVKKVQSAILKLPRLSNPNTPYYKGAFECVGWVKNFVHGLMYNLVYFPSHAVNNAWSTKGIRWRTVYDIFGYQKPSETNSAFITRIFPRPSCRRVRNTRPRQCAIGRKDRLKYYPGDGWYLERDIGPGFQKRVCKIMNGDIIYTAGGEDRYKGIHKFDLKHAQFIVINGNHISLWGAFKWAAKPEQRGTGLLEWKTHSKSYYHRRIVLKVWRPNYPSGHS